MNTPLMPKATAVWLVDNTALTFKQIAIFCGMHELEIQGIADGEVAQGIVGIDPIVNGQVTRDDITRCEKNNNINLTLLENNSLKPTKKNTTKYIPRIYRENKPNGIYWLLKSYVNIEDKDIVKILRVNKTSVEAIRDRSYWNMNNLTPRDPVLLGLCTQTELDDLAQKLHIRSISQAQNN